MFYEDENRETENFNNENNRQTYYSNSLNIETVEIFLNKINLSEEKSTIPTLSIKKIKMLDGLNFFKIFDNEIIQFDVMPEENSLLLIETENTDSVIGCGIIEKNQEDDYTLDIYGLKINGRSNFIGKNKSAVLALEKSSVLLWNADKINAVKFMNNMQINFNAHIFKPVNSGIIQTIQDEYQCSLAAGTYQTLNLTEGEKNISITLDEGIYAALVDSSGKILELLLNQKNQTAEYIFINNAKRLILINPADSIKKAAVNLKALEKAGYEISNTNTDAFEILVYKNSEYRLRFFNKNLRERLFLKGTFSSVEYIDYHGNYFTEPPFSFERTGVISAKVSPGFFKIWTDDNENNLRRYNTFSSAPEQINLSKKNYYINSSSKSVRLYIPAQSDNKIFMISLETPVTCVYLNDSTIYWINEFDAGKKILFPVIKSGLNVIEFSALGGNCSIGKIDISNAEMEYISDTFSKPAFISAGEIKAYYFNVEFDKKIGLGIKSDKDILECLLYDSNLKLIKTGHHQLVDLKKGKYIIEIRCPVSSETPVYFQTVIIGKEIPLNNIPMDYLKKLIGINN